MKRLSYDEGCTSQLYALCKISKAGGIDFEVSRGAEIDNGGEGNVECKNSYEGFENLEELENISVKEGGTPFARWENTLYTNERITRQSHVLVCRLSKMNLKKERRL